MAFLAGADYRVRSHTHAHTYARTDTDAHTMQTWRVMTVDTRQDLSIIHRTRNQSSGIYIIFDGHVRLPGISPTGVRPSPVLSLFLHAPLPPSLCFQSRIIIVRVTVHLRGHIICEQE